MGHALLAYQGLPGVNASSFDLTNVPDPNFSGRNGHFVFTEQYSLLAASHLETSATRANLSSGTLNAISKPNIFPSNRSATVPSNPQVDFEYFNRLPIPVNEEIAFQVSNNLGAATEQAWGLIWLATSDWSANIPRGKSPICMRATATIVPASLTWSGGTALTFEQSPRGGVYAVVGAECQGTNLIAFRLLFPRFKLYNGRMLRPGSLCINALGDVNLSRGLIDQYWLGEWGRFHTFEPPSIEVIMTTGASTPCEIRLFCEYLGESPDLLNGGMGGGNMAGVQTQGMGAY